MDSEEAVLFANLSFASDRFLFTIRRVASFHLGAENSRQLLTDKFNLHLQNCMLGISAYSMWSAVVVLSIEHGPLSWSLWSGIPGLWGIFPYSLLKLDRTCACGLPWWDSSPHSERQVNSSSLLLERNVYKTKKIGLASNLWKTKASIMFC